MAVWVKECDTGTADMPYISRDACTPVCCSRRHSLFLASKGVPSTLTLASDRSLSSSCTAPAAAAGTAGATLSGVPSWPDTTASDDAASLCSVSAAAIRLSLPPPRISSLLRSDLPFRIHETGQELLPRGSRIALLCDMIVEATCEHNKL